MGKRAKGAQRILQTIPFWYLLSVVLSAQSKYYRAFWIKGMQGHFPGSTPNSVVLLFPGLLFIGLALTLCLSTIWSHAWSFLTTLTCPFYKQTTHGFQSQSPGPALATHIHFVALLAQRIVSQEHPPSQHSSSTFYMHQVYNLSYCIISYKYFKKLFPLVD